MTTRPEPLPLSEYTQLLVLSMHGDLPGLLKFAIEKYGDPPPLRVLIHLGDVLSDHDYHRYLNMWQGARRRGEPHVDPDRVDWVIDVD